MEIVIQPDSEAATLIAARVIARLVRKKPDAVLGLATGSTPLLLYRELVKLKLDWRKVTTFNLDEYVGIAPSHPQSYHRFMHEHLFRHLNLAAKNIHVPDGTAKDIPAMCERYEKQIRAAGGIDLQLLGIGILVARIAHAHQNADAPHASRQRALFWRRPKSAAARHHHGHRHDHGRAALPAARIRTQQGAGDCRSRGRPGHRAESCVGFANAPEGDGLSGRGSSFPPENENLLSLGL